MTSVTIRTQRLDLVPMSPNLMEFLLDGDMDIASTIVGASFPAGQPIKRELLRLRMDQLRQDPSLQPWLLRAMVLRPERLVIGHIGFHTRPDPEYLAEISPGGIEFGYTVFPEYRRNGYAEEASLGLISWAREKHDIKRFVVSISPDNQPSMELARKLGFKTIGSHLDPLDGPEKVMELEVE